MRLGVMNHPRQPLEDEVRRAAEEGFDFLDLTLEPPAAWPLDGARAAALLSEAGLEAVGHTAFFLPIASPFAELRREARRLFGLALDTFAAAGVGLVNVHPDPGQRLTPPAENQARNAEAVAALAEDAAARGIRVMVENLGSRFATAHELRPILEAAPSVGLHLDVGHAHLHGGGPARLAELLDAFAHRLAHVHVHDNAGGPDDLHLPLGAGVVDWPGVVRALRAAAYDGTVTLEVFSAERAHLRTSRDLWRAWWRAGEGPARPRRATNI